ncbi:GNAT family N-acetyltransferase [Lacticaseibacillus zhaodongensis]|uniref:GNAT family N-acetyltransferase n=1 Tax=Lacticaseibacillus zhaodongensis TaxID=2668065 RepID=UPI0012D2B24C|nr:GNAT family N-acetyltransferase [Lacticaseibacillus zhaodongensis]
MALIYMRLAQMEDLDAIWTIIQEAKQLLASENSPQWQDGYPTKAKMEADITAGVAHVLIVDGEIAGTASVIIGNEPTYDVIHDGEWAEPFADYATIHRIAIASGHRGQHLAKFFFSNIISELYLRGIHNVRLDTHRINKAMQHLATEFGFTKRGIIMIDHGEDRERFAYELNM